MNWIRLAPILSELSVISTQLSVISTSQYAFVAFYVGPSNVYGTFGNVHLMLRRVNTPSSEVYGRSFEVDCLSVLVSVMTLVDASPSLPAAIPPSGFKLMLYLVSIFCASNGGRGISHKKAQNSQGSSVNFVLRNPYTKP